MYGTTNKILRVDLDTNTLKTEILSEEFYRLYPGGKALAGYFLLNELPAHTEPLSPENVMVFANGLLTGAPVSTATRYVVSARSPLTNGHGESESKDGLPSQCTCGCMMGKQKSARQRTCGGG
jgi:aldehyde:ferredoxin oxidoreductase